MDMRPEISSKLEHINKQIDIDALLFDADPLLAEKKQSIGHLITVLEEKLFTKIDKAFEPRLKPQSSHGDRKIVEIYKKEVTRSLTLVEELLAEAITHTAWDKPLRTEFLQRKNSSPTAAIDALTQLQGLLQSYLDLFAEWEIMAPQEIKLNNHEATQKIKKIEQYLSEILIGQEAVVRQVVIALFSGGHVLLEGNPGLGKTKLAESLGQGTGLQFNRISCTPDLTATDVLGGYVQHATEDGSLRYDFKEGPIFTNILLLDELNRATPKTQSALLEAMQEKRVTNSKTRRLPNPFFVIATQNNREEVGTYPLPKAQLDRFLFKITMDLPENGRLSHMLQTALTGGISNTKEQLTTIEEVRAIQKTAENIAISKQIYDYVANIVKNLHPERSGISTVREYLEVGTSPRGSLDILRAARVHALLNDRTSVSIDDVTAVAHAALCHRITINMAGLTQSISPEQIIDDVLQNTTMN